MWSFILVLILVVAWSFFSRFLQVRTRVLIHIDNKIIFGGSALENSDGVNLPVWVW